MLGCLSTNQNLTDVVLINRFQQILCITIKNNLLTLHHRQLLDVYFGGHNEPTSNQLRSRNIDDDLTINPAIVHARFSWSKRMLGRSCEEVATICIGSIVLCCRIEVTLHRIMCLIKVDRIHINLCLLKTIQGVIGSEDQFVPLSITNPLLNLTRTSRGFVRSFATVNVKHIGIGDTLKKLTRELLSKQNARADYNNGLCSCRQKLTNSIVNHVQSLATTSRHNDLTFAILLHSNISTLLVRTELNAHKGCAHTIGTLSGAQLLLCLCF